MKKYLIIIFLSFLMGHFSFYLIYNPDNFYKLAKNWASQSYYNACLVNHGLSCKKQTKNYLDKF